MANVNDLDFKVTLYRDDCKIRVFTLNFLLPRPYEVIEDYFLPIGQEFYTSVVIEHAGKVILNKSLLNGNRLTAPGI